MIIFLKKHWLALLFLTIALTVMVGAKFYDNNSVFQNTQEKSYSTDTGSPDSLLEQQTKTPTSSLPSTNGIIKKNVTKNPSLDKQQAITVVTTTASDPPRTTSTIQATMELQGKSFPLSNGANSTVYDALLELASDKKITVEFKSFNGLGYFVESLNGQSSNKIKGQYWIFSINGVKSQVGISGYILKQDDVITWKYESAE